MLEIGSLVDNKYRVLDVVGSGGMSTVYLARNEKANKSWAIKEVLKLGQEDLEIKKNSLIAETEMLKKLNHPNLPAIIDVIETDDTYLVVMDYIEGNDLGEIIKEFGAQPQEKVIEWGKQVCDVLGYLHTRKPVIVYRDLKPANIMLKPDGNITLIDFGTAREAEVKDVANTISLGTRGYAAPEQFGDGARADARTDIYCFGATLYHMVPGHNPAEEPYIIQPIRDINPALSGGLEKIILKCTMADPAKRYQDCDELMYDLEHYEEIDEIYRKKQKNKLSLFVTMMALCVLFYGISAFGFFMNKSQTEQKYSNAVQNGKYFEAIQIDDSNKEAYLGLIHSLTEKDGKIDNEDDTQISKFNGYVKEKSNGELIVPINSLAQSSVKDYLEVCFETGYSYWEYYQTPKTRPNHAAPWFKRILPANYSEMAYKDVKNDASYELIINGGKSVVAVGDDADIPLYKFTAALVCTQISDCMNTIEKYEHATITTNSLSAEENIKNAYVELWKQINNLYHLSNSIDDVQLRVVICNEIYNSFTKNIDNMIAYNSISEEQYLEFSSAIKEKVTQMDTPSSNITKKKDALLLAIDNADKEVGDYFIRKAR